MILHKAAQSLLHALCRKMRSLSTLRGAQSWFCHSAQSCTKHFQSQRGFCTKRAQSCTLHTPHSPTDYIRAVGPPRTSARTIDPVRPIRKLGKSGPPA